MVSNKLNTREEIIFLLRGFFATPIISGLAKHGIIDEILDKKFSLNNYKKYNTKLLKDSLDYLIDIGLIKLKQSKIYVPTLLGKKVLKRSGSFILLHSYHEYINNFSKSLIDKNILSKCDRLENVLGSGMVHGRKYFNDAIDNIDLVYKNKPNIYVDIGCGDGKFLNILNSKVKKSKLVGIDLSKISINETKNKIKLKHQNKLSAFKENAFNIDGIKIKLSKLKIDKDENILFTFWFIFHEINDGSKYFLKNYLSKLKKHFRNSKVLICEINKVNYSTLVENKLMTVMPEYFYFHSISNQKLMRKVDIKNNINKSEYSTIKELNYDYYKEGQKKIPSIFIYYLE